MIKISVIVTTFNRKTLLLRTINSILNQTHKNIELIIVDNFSNYDFPAFIKSIGDSRIKSYQNYNNGIIAVNRNFGSMMSSSNYLAFCDDDDFWMKDKLDLQLKIMLNNPDILLNATLAKKNGFKTNFGQNNFGIMYRNVSLSRVFLVRYNPIITSSVLIRKETFNSLKGFSEDKELTTVEDLDLWLRLFDSGKISILKQVLLKYEIHDNNATKFHFDKRLKYLQKQNLNINKITLPFESNKSIPFIILKSLIHLLYIIYYKIIHTANRFFYINNRLLIISSLKK